MRDASTLHILQSKGLEKLTLTKGVKTYLQNAEADSTQMDEQLRNKKIELEDF